MKRTWLLSSISIMLCFALSEGGVYSRLLENHVCSSKLGDSVTSPQQADKESCCCQVVIVSCCDEPALQDEQSQPEQSATLTSGHDCLCSITGSLPQVPAKEVTETVSASQFKNHADTATTSRPKSFGLANHHLTIQQNTIPSLALSRIANCVCLRI